MVKAALKRPVTVLVLFMGLLLFSVLAVRKVPIDIFPQLNLPTMYVIESFGGMSPQQMEGFFATRLQDQFLYVNGIRNIESRNIQGLTLIKLSFYEQTNMAEAAAQVALQVNRAMKFFPPGALPPQVVRFDASSLPVGQLVFSSKTRSLKDIYDMAATRIRPLFATIPGLSAPPPFGANSRSVVVNVDPQKLRALNISPDAVVNAIADNNLMTPSGNLRQDSLNYVTTLNSLEDQVADFGNIPLSVNGSNALFLHDVATVTDGADITVDYALVNGKRSVYIPIVKTADASTWDVVQSLKSRLAEMRSLLSEDVQVTYEFDQSVFVINSVKSLLTEGLLGAILTGLMVLLFLKDWRSSIVVIVTIPVAILSSVLCLKLAGQTINLMTLSGLALAIGILVDQATVTIENIHQHLEMGKPKRQAILDACSEISFPLLLILLCILAVFAPSFVMSGVPKAMFLPLSLSIAFAMIVSFVAAQTLVPVISNWLLKASMFQKHSTVTGGVTARPGFFDWMKNSLINRLTVMMRWKKSITVLYLLLVLAAAGTCFLAIGKDLLPHSNAGQLQLRLKMPDGTRLENTEAATKKVLAILDETTGGHIAISSAYVGIIPSSYGTSNLYVFNSGMHEAILQVNLAEDYHTDIDDLKETIRNNVTKALPGIRLSFEPIELTEKIMAQGAATPVEVRIAGKDYTRLKQYALRLVSALQQVNFLRDVQLAQPTGFPTINITVDRFRLAQMGLSFKDVARSITEATSSSRFTEKNQWLDKRSAYTYHVQVQVPDNIMNSVAELKSVSLVRGKARPLLSDVATFTYDAVPGEYDRSGPRRFLTVSANLHHTDLGTATAAVQEAIARLGNAPPGMQTEVRGISSLLVETLDSLQSGLLAAVVVILLLLAANYQSFPLAFAVLTTIPAVLLGALAFLLLTGSTLNLQSYMGIIMSVGVSVANAILIATNAETLRLEYRDAGRAAVASAGLRLRPILMTSLAMIAGMIPMASGLGESGDQSAPLGRAVIGGLIASTFAALFIVPLAFTWAKQKSPFRPISLLPEQAPDTTLSSSNINQTAS
jgi:multidrug efflux pump subunit AcrB